jgi:hypothetical protein
MKRVSRPAEVDEAVDDGGVEARQQAVQPQQVGDDDLRVELVEAPLGDEEGVAGWKRRATAAGSTLRVRYMARASSQPPTMASTEMPIAG